MIRTNSFLLAINIINLAKEDNYNQNNFGKLISISVVNITIFILSMAFFRHLSLIKYHFLAVLFYINRKTLIYKHSIKPCL